jgi:hypothetical protein
VERSLKRLLNLRIAFAEPDAAKIGSDLEERRKLVFLDGSALRLSIYAGKEERVPVRVEERVPPSGNFEKLAYVPLVQLFSLRDLLLIDHMDLADPLVLKIDESAVEAMRGKCKNFSWDFVRDASGAFVVKSSTSAFALARSRLDEFFGFLASGKLEASDVVGALKVPAEFMPDANSDFSGTGYSPEEKEKTEDGSHFPGKNQHRRTTPAFGIITRKQPAKTTVCTRSWTNSSWPFAAAGRLDVAAQGPRKHTCSRTIKKYKEDLMETFMETAKKRLISHWMVQTADEAFRLGKSSPTSVGMWKIGLELFFARGPRGGGAQCEFWPADFSGSETARHSGHGSSGNSQFGRAPAALSDCGTPAEDWKCCAWRRPPQKRFLAVPPSSA